MKIIELLLEKAPSDAPKKAQELYEILAAHLPIKDGKRRGEQYDQTEYYSLRIMPLEKGGDLLADTLKFVKSAGAKKAGIKFEREAPMMHSAKFTSVLVSFKSQNFGIVVGAGANKGEDFEKTLLKQMDDLVKEIGSEEDAKLAFAALEKADPKIKLKNAAEVIARTGSTKRADSKSAEETGKIIADIIVVMKNGSQHYISVKDPNGATVANFGISAAFKEDLTVNTTSDAWKNWIKPFGVDAKKVGEGLQAYAAQSEVSWNDIVAPKLKVGAAKEIEEVMKKLWGAGYVYLRKTSTGFYAQKINDSYLDKILAGLLITEIRYPCKSRKQITITCESPEIKMAIEIRNPSGQIRPKDMKLKVVGKSKK